MVNIKMECTLCLESTDPKNFNEYECCKAQACNSCYTRWRDHTYGCPFCRTERQRDQGTQFSHFPTIISMPAPAPIAVPTNEEMYECSKKKLRGGVCSMAWIYVFYYLIIKGW
jgi:hypothetical protein